MTISFVSVQASPTHQKKSDISARSFLDLLPFDVNWMARSLGMECFSLPGLYPFFLYIKLHDAPSEKVFIYFSFRRPRCNPPAPTPPDVICRGKGTWFLCCSFPNVTDQHSAHCTVQWLFGVMAGACLEIGLHV